MERPASHSGPSHHGPVRESDAPVEDRRSIRAGRASNAPPGKNLFRNASRSATCGSSPEGWRRNDAAKGAALRRGVRLTTEEPTALPLSGQTARPARKNAAGRAAGLGWLAMSRRQESAATRASPDRTARSRPAQAASGSRNRRYWRSGRRRPCCAPAAGSARR